jgi:hypothetical protein
MIGINIDDIRVRNEIKVSGFGEPKGVLGTHLMAQDNQKDYGE